MEVCVDPQGNEADDVKRSLEAGRKLYLKCDGFQGMSEDVFFKLVKDLSEFEIASVFKKNLATWGLVELRDPGENEDFIGSCSGRKLPAGNLKVEKASFKQNPSSDNQNSSIVGKRRKFSSKNDLKMKKRKLCEDLFLPPIIGKTAAFSLKNAVNLSILDMKMQKKKKKHFSRDGEKFSETTESVHLRTTPLFRYSYPLQLQLKHQYVNSCLRGLRKQMIQSYSLMNRSVDWCRKFKVLPTIPSPVCARRGYRNKCEFSIGLDEEGSIEVGFVAKISEMNPIVQNPSGCLHVPYKMQEICFHMRKFIKNSGFPVYDRRNRTGCWRMLMIRDSPLYHQTMIVVQIAPLKPLADEESSSERLALLKAQLEDFFFHGLPRVSGIEITSLLLQEHDGAADSFEDRPISLLKGLPYIEQSILAVRYKLSSASFCQTNTIACHLLYEAAMKLLRRKSQIEDREAISSQTHSDANTHSNSHTHSDANTSSHTHSHTNTYSSSHSPVHTQMHSDSLTQTHTRLITDPPVSGARDEDLSGTQLSSFAELQCIAIPPIPHHQRPYNDCLFPGSAMTDLWESEDLNRREIALQNASSEHPLFKHTEEERSLLPPCSKAGSIEDGGIAVLDVCCGIGAIGLCVCKRFPEIKKVIGIEMNHSAVVDAQYNAELNGLQERFTVAEGKAEDVLPKILRDIPKEYQILAILDPPRAGLHCKVLEALRDNERIASIVYISCNPESFAQDALRLCAPPDCEVLLKNSDRYVASSSTPFFLEVAVPVDMFPHTLHCEMIAKLNRGEVNSSSCQQLEGENISNPLL